MASDVLVIVSSDWTPINLGDIQRLINWSLPQFIDIQGRSMYDLNMYLRPTGWLPEGKRVLDVFVINEQLFMKFELDLD